ncbi:hypothetical protein TNCV_3972491 [Trichonephila clavipes]|nr:hypothetical protein TNCV_3972491 [Trichonephila clavipes]
MFTKLLAADAENNYHSPLGIFGPRSAGCGRQIESGKTELLHSHHICTATGLEDYEGCCHTQGRSYRRINDTGPQATGPQHV